MEIIRNLEVFSIFTKDQEIPDDILEGYRTGKLKKIEFNKITYFINKFHANAKIIKAYINIDIMKMMQDNNNISIKQDKEKIKDFYKKWIIKKDRASENQLKSFLKIFSNRSSILVTFPKFLESDFIKNVSEIRYITADYEINKKLLKRNLKSKYLCPNCKTIVQFHGGLNESLICPVCDYSPLVPQPAL